MTFDEIKTQLIESTLNELVDYDLSNLPTERRRNIEWRVAYFVADGILAKKFTDDELAAIVRNRPDLSGSWAVPARFKVLSWLAREAVEAIHPTSERLVYGTAGGAGVGKTWRDKTEGGFGEILASLLEVAEPEMEFWGADFSLPVDEWHAAAWDHLEKFTKAFVPDDIGAEALIELFACRPGLLDDDDMGYRLDFLASVRGQLIEETVAALRPDAAGLEPEDIAQVMPGVPGRNRIALERRKALARVIERRAERLDLEIPDGLVELLAGDADEELLMAMIETIDQMDDVTDFLASHGVGHVAPTPF